MATVFEQVIFLNDYDPEGEKALGMIEDGDLEGALNYLQNWHWPGEHETREESGRGYDDEVYESDDYIMAWNTGLGYIGLEYEDYEQ